MDVSATNQIEMIDDVSAEKIGEPAAASADEKVETNCIDGVCTLVWKPVKK